MLYDVQKEQEKNEEEQDVKFKTLKSQSRKR